MDNMHMDNMHMDNMRTRGHRAVISTLEDFRYKFVYWFKSTKYGHIMVWSTHHLFVCFK